MEVVGLYGPKFSVYDMLVAVSGSCGSGAVVALFNSDDSDGRGANFTIDITPVPGKFALSRDLLLFPTQSHRPQSHQKSMEIRFSRDGHHKAI